MKDKLFILILLSFAGFIYYQSILDSTQRHIEKDSSPEPELPENIPDIYLHEFTFSRVLKNCVHHPNLLELRFKNHFWQVQSIGNRTFYLLNAYFDARSAHVKVAGTYNEYQSKTQFYCQFWYKGKFAPVAVPSDSLLWMFRQNWGADSGDFNHPYLLSCPLPANNAEVPVAVSVVSQPCQQATNNLRVLVSPAVGKKQDFVVCVKGLAFQDESKAAKLVEWIELVKILGASKIHFYIFNVHSEIRKVINYYVRRGDVDITPLALVDDVSTHPMVQNKFLKYKIIERRLEEVIPFNDCLYKHYNEYKYVVLLDIDEVIIPTKRTWQDLLEQAQERAPGRASYLARNVYFLDNYQHNHSWIEGIPRNFHMLQHIYRSAEYSKPRASVKGFHDTRQVLGLHNHFPIYCISGCTFSEMDLNLTQLQHYREDCSRENGNCKAILENSVADTRLWKYKKELLRNGIRVFEELNFSTS